MKFYQKEIPFKKIHLIIENKEEAKILRYISDFFTSDMVEDNIITQEIYNFCVKLSDAFTECALEVPLTAEEKHDVY